MTMAKITAPCQSQYQGHQMDTYSKPGMVAPLPHGGGLGGAAAYAHRPGEVYPPGAVQAEQGGNLDDIGGGKRERGEEQPEEQDPGVSSPHLYSVQVLRMIRMMTQASNLTKAGSQ